MLEIDKNFVLKTLFNLTGFQYVFAEARGRIYKGKEENDGIYYQLMPKTTDDGFFDWYCVEYEGEQFYISQCECALKFISSYLDWKNI